MTQFLDKIGLNYFWLKIKQTFPTRNEILDSEEAVSAALNDLNTRIPENISEFITGSDLKTINGQLITGSGDININFYGESSTPAATILKEISIPSIITLNVGQFIIVKPTITSTVANSTIKLNNFDAYPMRYNSSAITTSTDSVVWNANYPSIFVFDGSYWVFAGHGLDSNTTYSGMTLAEATAGTATANRVISAKVLNDTIDGKTPKKISLLENDSGFLTEDAQFSTIGLSATIIDTGIDHLQLVDASAAYQILTSHKPSNIIAVIRLESEVDADGTSSYMDSILMTVKEIYSDDNIFVFNAFTINYEYTIVLSVAPSSETAVIVQSEFKLKTGATTEVLELKANELEPSAYEFYINGNYESNHSTVRSLLMTNKWFVYRDKYFHLIKYSPDESNGNIPYYEFASYDRENERLEIIRLNWYKSNSMFQYNNFYTVNIGGSGGDANVIESVKVNGTALTPDSSKAVDINVPVNVSDLNNDLNYIRKVALSDQSLLIYNPEENRYYDNDSIYSNYLILGTNNLYNVEGTYSVSFINSCLHIGYNEGQYPNTQAGFNTYIKNILLNGKLFSSNSATDIRCQWVDYFYKDIQVYLIFNKDNTNYIDGLHFSFIGAEEISENKYTILYYSALYKGYKYTLSIHYDYYNQTLISNPFILKVEKSNIQSDWNETDTTSATYIQNKPTIPAAVTESTVSGWGFTKNTGTYSKPSGGIPSSDLASSVQTSLGKADTALQSFTESDPTVPSHVKSITTTDISNWNSKVSNVQADWNATSGDAAILNKPTIPTKTSQLTNDSNFLTEDDVQRFFTGTQTISENQDIAGAKDGDIYMKTV